MLALQIRSLRRAISPGGVRLDHATSLPLSPCANFHEILSCYASSLLGHGPLRALGSLQVVAERISNLTRAPTRYFEPFQILKYDEGQFYKSHHDQNSGRFTPQGARVYTFFMYLSTPAEGGGTKFTDLGLVVPAVKGNAVIWPSVMNENPQVDEPYTNHEALPPVSGRKFASNAWIHNFDYQTPADKGCILTHRNTH